MPDIIDQDEYEKAVTQVSHLVKKKAWETAKNLAFEWNAVPDAPDTYEKLVEAYEASQRTGTPLPVSSLFCDNVVYREDADNYAMRFWHDTLHIETGLTFSLDDELELGLYHLALAEEEGFKKGSLAWQILRVDMLGQNYLLGVAKRFPINQRDFVVGCIKYGIDEGILEEIRKYQKTEQ